MGSLYGNDVPDKLNFTLEWFDREADLMRNYNLIFYTVDDSIEIRDLVSERKFLHRMKVENVTRSDFYIGSVLNIYSRPMTIKAYGDQCTTNFLQTRTERAFLLVKPEAVEFIGDIIERIERTDLKIIRVKMAKVGFEMASKFYSDHQGKEEISKIAQHLSSGPLVAFILVAECAIEKLQLLIGSEDPSQARIQNSNSFRALYGSDLIHNGFHASEDAASVLKDSSYFFAATRDKIRSIAPNTATIQGGTCCIIKPHAVKEGLSGQIISDIQKLNFKITALEMFYLDRTHAEEFYEIYKGVVSEYAAMTFEMTVGPCIVLEVSSGLAVVESQCEIVKKFRNCVGPSDSELAKTLRPHSLRARYGCDKTKNAIHCTDLPEEATTELEYFFRILTLNM